MSATILSLTSYNTHNCGRKDSLENEVSRSSNHSTVSVSSIFFHGNEAEIEDDFSMYNFSMGPSDDITHNNDTHNNDLADEEEDSVYFGSGECEKLLNVPSQSHDKSIRQDSLIPKVVPSAGKSSRSNITTSVGSEQNDESVQTLSPRTKSNNRQRPSRKNGNTKSLTSKHKGTTSEKDVNESGEMTDESSFGDSTTTVTTTTGGDDTNAVQNKSSLWPFSRMRKWKSVQDKKQVQHMSSETSLLKAFKSFFLFASTTKTMSSQELWRSIKINQKPRHSCSQSQSKRVSSRRRRRFSVSAPPITALTPSDLWVMTTVKNTKSQTGTDGEC